ncbi:COP9 signalosome complex subunit 1 isoform X9 [Lagenorhynchus albirostris]|uniref:COP9 signalosome complex subunit 1 isoform X9 n=1 Tax=Lagenorhynchus albirostris TaxID=27610 RepID=UPI0028EE14C6|nr:COP9 signalosome complex subunit 1 isoform X9 [Lagenorhynchus albirostris]
MPLPVQVFNLQQPASSVSGSGGAESQDRMRGGPAPRAAASSVADVHCAPPSGRSELFLPGTAGDFSLSASLSACTLLYEGAVEPMQIDVDPQEDPQNAPDVNYVVENPTLDLEQYAASYSGLMRIERLQFIADHCPPLRVEALKMALSFVQRTFNVDMYEEIHRKLLEAARELQNAPDAIPESGVEPPPLDTAWVEATRKKALLKLEKLDTDLKNYKGNSIKESIRRGHDDLGDHYLDCGDLSNALKCYSRARDYCTSAKHVINMCLNVIKVSVYLQNWSHVLSYVSKAESTPEIAEQRGERDTQTQAILTKLKCAAGLAELAARKYKQAAKCFLLASFDHCDFPELLSPSNVAVYGGLCALATFDRQELQRNVISSSSFKLFLELEPQVRDIIFKFYESKYASCLKMLDEMKDNLLLDMYLAPHVRTLYTQIRNRALIQYFSPYVSADMRKMATAFNTTVAALEDELTQLILEGLINARIDSHSKVGSLRAVGCGRETLGPTEPCTSTDPICPGRGSAQHHLREVPADGQGVPAPCQSHDPEGSRATQPDPCQVPSPGREPRGADASQQPVPDEHQHVRAPSASRTVCTPSALPHPPPSDSWASHLLQQHFQRCCLWPTCRGLAAG